MNHIMALLVTIIFLINEIALIILIQSEQK